MQSLLRKMWLSLAIVIIMLAFGATTAPAHAQSDVAETADKPFILPFAEPSNLDTWLLAQPYGNTTGAYRQRFTTYGLSGGIHFGLDLAAPCGTEIVAIADGIVFAVDGPFGSPPHNLMIDHPELGYASMYGHLFEAPTNLRPGDVVEQGQVIAFVGDSRDRCYRRPHLHLEIRDLAHVKKYNPIPLIEANWDSLALIGSDGRDFAYDLAAPRKWQSLYDQPEARTAGPIINDFDYVWPIDWEKGAPTPPVSTIPLQTKVVYTNSLQILLVGQQITAGPCCTQPYWAGPDEIRFVDQPNAGAALGIWGVDLQESPTTPALVRDRLGVYSPREGFITFPNLTTGLTIVERLFDGRQWEIDTSGENVSFSPNGRNILWTVDEQNVPRDNRLQTMWVSNLSGTNQRQIIQERRIDDIGWLTSTQLLMARTFQDSSDVQLFTLSTLTGEQEVLIERMPRMRGTALSPNNRYLVYYTVFDPTATNNGIWLLDLENPTEAPQQLPFFGTYRWRDNDSLIYIPFEPEATTHQFFEYDVVTGQSTLLFPEDIELIVANNDWQVSPDGSKIVMLAAEGQELGGLWVLDLPQP